MAIDTEDDIKHMFYDWDGERKIMLDIQKCQRNWNHDKWFEIEEELVAVRDKLKIPDNEIEQVGKIFNKAKEESTGYEPYAKQIAQIYNGNINVLEEVINILFYIAEADGNISKSELIMIENI